MVRTSVEELTKECNRLYQVAETIGERRDVFVIQDRLKKDIEALREARKKDEDYNMNRK